MMRGTLVVTALVVLATSCKGGCASSGGPLYRIETHPVTLATGANGEVVIRFVGLDGFHWNEEYPAKLKVEDSGGVIPSKTDFGQDDFKVEGGMGVLAMPVTGRTAGMTTIKATASFSICVKKECRFFKGVAVEAPIEVR